MVYHSQTTYHNIISKVIKEGTARAQANQAIIMVKLYFVPMETTITMMLLERLTNTDYRL